MATTPAKRKAATQDRGSSGGSVPSWIPPPMDTNTQPQNDDDTAFLIIIALLTIIVLGLGPIVVHMHLKTEAKLAEMEQERKASERLRKDIQRLLNEEKNK